MALRRKDPGPRSMVRFIGRVIEGSRPSAYPGFIEPSLATLRASPPTQDKYVHEIKFDGYRIQAHLRGGLPALYTRSGLDWTRKFNPVAVALGKIPATDVILDGEVISANAKGHADFSALQDDLSRGRLDRMIYYAFDILFLDGFDLRGASLIDRKRVLSGLLAEARDIRPIVYSEHLEADGEAMFKQACDMKLEGVVSKLRNAPYKSGRNENWLKLKCARSELSRPQSGQGIGRVSKSPVPIISLQFFCFLI
jgi:bifunctional non-homologous end joining protein LigD